MMQKRIKHFTAFLFAAIFLFFAVACQGSSAADNLPESDPSYAGNTVTQLPYTPADTETDTDFTALYEDTRTSVVTVSIPYTTNEIHNGQYVRVQKTACATGFIVNKERGYILSSSYLFEEKNAADCSVTFYDGTEAAAVLCGYDSVSAGPFRTEFANSDIAVLEIKDGIPSEASEAAFADSASLQYGDTCYTIAAVRTENGDFASVLDANIITKPYITHESSFYFDKGSKGENLFDGSFDSLVMTGITMREGGEGAPLFDAAGRVVGMLNARAEQTYTMRENKPYGIAFATPASVIKALLNDFYAKEELPTEYPQEQFAYESIFTADTELEKQHIGSSSDPAFLLSEQFPDYYIASDSGTVIFSEGIYAESEGSAAQSVAEKRVNSTIKIVHYAEETGGIFLSEGSGFLINTDGYLLTNLHVINRYVQDVGSIADFNENVPSDLDSGTFYAVFENGLVDGNGRAYSGSGDAFYALLPLEVVAFDKAGDLALLRFANTISHMENGAARSGFADEAVCRLQTRVQFGETVVAIGNPEGYGIALTQGIVSNPACDYYASDVGYLHVMTDCPINSGNSGGPLFNTEGEVVAINTLGLNTDAYPGYDNISWSIRADAAVKFLQTVNTLAQSGGTHSIGAFRGDRRVYAMGSRVPSGGVAYTLA